MTLVTWETIVAHFPANDYLNEFSVRGKICHLQVMDSDYFLMLIVINKNHFSHLGHIKLLNSLLLLIIIILY